VGVARFRRRQPCSGSSAHTFPSWDCTGFRTDCIAAGRVTTRRRGRVGEVTGRRCQCGHGWGAREGAVVSGASVTNALRCSF